LLHGLHRYEGRTGLRLQSVFGGAGVDADPAAVEAAILAAYTRAPQLAGGGVTLTELRPLLPDLPRAAVDDALVRLGRQHHISLLPNENRKALTEADREAAVQIGPAMYHYLLIEGA
jgi:hypothetical protein